MPLTEQRNLVEKAEKLAKSLHAEQFDKAGKPYIEHLSFVANHPLMTNAELKAVAWLHDSIEDSDIQYNQLAMRFGGKIAGAVKAITKINGEQYQAYLERVKANPIARQVKLADLSHNMDLSRLPEITDKDKKRLAKYQRAVEFLSA